MNEQTSYMYKRDDFISNFLYLLSLWVYAKAQLCTTNLCILFFGSNLRLYIATVAETFGYMGRVLSVACHRSLPYQGKTTVILISMAVSRPITELQLRSTQRWAVFAMSWARRWKTQRLYIRTCSPSSMILLPTTLNMVSKQNTLVSKHIVYKPHNQIIQKVIPLAHSLTFLLFRLWQAADDMLWVWRTSL